MKKYSLRLIGLSFIVSLSACSKIDSVLDSKVSVNYQNNKSVKALEVPPDLTAPQYDNAFALPAGGTVSVASMQNGVTFNPSSITAASVGGSGVAGSSAASVVSARTGDLTSVKSKGKATVLQINDSYQRAVILTDIILERMGFSIVRRNESRGIYHLQYNGDDVLTSEKPGFFSRLFKRSANRALVQGERYQVQINNENGSPILQFKKGNGKPLSVTNQKRIIALLNKEFNR